MLVSKICLTGGPCAGKTKILSTLEKELTIQGYKVFIIDEIVTKYINKGLKPFGEDCLNMYDFENIILKNQIVEEQSYEKASSLIDKPCILICDRGVYDIRSFVTPSVFDELLKENGLSKLSLMDNYNLVIHMNTTAKGAEEFYTLDNNEARSEGIKEARIRDDKCQDAWSFHNNFKIVDNSTNFEEKIQRVVNIIKMSLGIQTKKERKYLVEMNDILDKKLREKEVVKIDITQNYLETGNDSELRLRKRSLDGESTYYVTAKKSNNINQKIVTEEKIDKKTFERLLQQRKIINTVEKERFCFVDDNNLYKLDKFIDGTFILEALDGVKLPSYVNVIREVSFDEKYQNKNIRIRKTEISPQHQYNKELKMS